LMATGYASARVPRTARVKLEDCILSLCASQGQTLILTPS
jgi:hypothetical protein